LLLTFSEIKPFPFAPITVSDWGAGHLVSPTKVKALAVSITKRNLDFLRVEDFGKLYLTNPVFAKKANSQKGVFRLSRYQTKEIKVRKISSSTDGNLQQH